MKVLAVALLLVLSLPWQAVVAMWPCPESPSAEGVLGVVQNGGVGWCFRMEVRGSLNKKSSAWGLVFSPLDRVELVRLGNIQRKEHWYRLGKLESPPSREGGSDSVVDGAEISGMDVKWLIEKNIQKDTSASKKKYSIKIKEGESKRRAGYTLHVGTLVLSEYTSPPPVRSSPTPSADYFFEAASTNIPVPPKEHPRKWLKTNCKDKSKQILGLRLDGKVHWCQPSPHAKGKNAAKEWGIAIPSDQDASSLRFQLSPFAELQEGNKWYPLQTIRYANNGRIEWGKGVAVFSKKLKASEVVAHITKQLTTELYKYRRAVIRFSFEDKPIDPSLKQEPTLILFFGAPHDYKKPAASNENSGNTIDKWLIIPGIVALLCTLCGLMYWCYVRNIPPYLWLKNKLSDLIENEVENKDLNERKMEDDLDRCKIYYIKQYTNKNKRVAIYALYQAALAYQRISLKKREESERGISNCLVLMKKASKDLPFQVLEEQQLHRVENLVKQLPDEVSQSMLPLYQAIEACVDRLFDASLSTMKIGTVGFKITRFAAIYNEKSIQYPVLTMLYYVISRASKAFDSECDKLRKFKKIENKYPPTYPEKTVEKNEIHSLNDIKEIITTAIEKEMSPLLAQSEKISIIQENIKLLADAQTTVAVALDESIIGHEQIKKTISSLNQHDQKLESYHAIIASAMGESAVLEIKKLQTR